MQGDLYKDKRDIRNQVPTFKCQPTHHHSYQSLKMLFQIRIDILIAMLSILNQQWPCQAHSRSIYCQEYVNTINIGKWFFRLVLIICHIGWLWYQTHLWKHVRNVDDRSNILSFVFPTGLCYPTSSWDQRNRPFSRPMLWSAISRF